MSYPDPNQSQQGPPPGSWPHPYPPGPPGPWPPPAPTPAPPRDRSKAVTIVGSTITLIVFLIFAVIALFSVKTMLIALFVGLPIVIALAAATFIIAKAVSP